MDAMLHAFGGILLRAVPTFLLVVLLHFYLKSMFFKPMKDATSISWLTRIRSE